MPQARHGDTVHIHYTGRLEDGTVFDSSLEREPLSFTLGEGQVIPGFDAAVTGMDVGESKVTTIPSAEAYGSRKEELELSMPRSQFPDGVEPEVGQQFQMRTQAGQTFPVTVTGTSEDTVQLDANHPLAGKDLTFDIQLVKVV